MAYAIELYFDASTEARFRTVWEELAGHGIAAPAANPVARPHVTLAVYAELHRDRCGPRLAAFAAATAPLSLSFAAIGLFPFAPPAGVVFAGPTVTGDLLALQRRAHDRLAGAVEEPWGYYLPDRWVPHCTLTERCPPERVGEVVTVCQRLALPLHGRVEAVGLVRTRPLQRVALYSLRGT